MQKPKPIHHRAGATLEHAIHGEQKYGGNAVPTENISVINCDSNLVYLSHFYLNFHCYF